MCTLIAGHHIAEHEYWWGSCVVLYMLIVLFRIPQVAAISNENEANSDFTTAAAPPPSESNRSLLIYMCNVMCCDCGLCQ
ncbi:unnamed protein product [Gongylonema pulchrum]|uniref:Secreted protein n=1 Tax=Gongylonema pulchrum TaxID=637853 RepID=A0A183D1Z7_9BILA|nr:unnamed protein product [Gongylonema pulchrum]